MSLDTSKLATYTPSAYPTVDGGMSTYLTTEFRKIGQATKSLDEILTSVASGLNADFITFAPTISALAGTLTTVSVMSAAYQQYGKLVVARYTISFTNIGSASGAVKFTLPVAAVTGSYGPVTGINLMTSKTLGGLSAWDSSTSGRVYNYDGSFPVANGQDLMFTVVYDTA